MLRSPYGGPGNRGWESTAPERGAAKSPPSPSAPDRGFPKRPSERAGEASRAAAGLVRDRDVPERNRHRRVAVRLEGGRHGEDELGLAVLDGEIASGRDALLVGRLRVIVARVDAQGRRASTTCTCSSSPRPASLPDTVRLSSARVIVNALLMKCGLPACATGTAMAPVASASRKQQSTHERHPFRLFGPSLALLTGGRARGESQARLSSNAAPRRVGLEVRSPLPQHSRPKSAGLAFALAQTRPPGCCRRVPPRLLGSG
jgi:hypothetical protein